MGKGFTFDKVNCRISILFICFGSDREAISTNLEAATAQYVDVRLERKKAVLETYHKALHPQKTAPEKDAASKDTPKKTKKRSSGIEL